MKQKPDAKLDPAIHDQDVLITALRGVVIQQCHGQLVIVPPGWAHSVLNRAPNFKVAWETTHLEHAASYPRTAVLTAKFIGDRAAADYMPYQAMAFSIVRQHQH